MISKQIVYFGQSAILACDGKCTKAWGANGKRPQIDFDPDDEDDFAYLADNEVGEAPVNPGTYEGGEGKPQGPSARLNKWCARECERSTIVPPGKDIVLPDFSKRVYNCPSRQQAEESK